MVAAMLSKLVYTMSIYFVFFLSGFRSVNSNYVGTQQNVRISMVFSCLIYNFCELCMIQVEVLHFCPRGLRSPW